MSKSLVTDVITVEVVGKFGPKAVREGEDEASWFGVKKPLKAGDFSRDTSYEVELEEWQTGRFNIVKAKEVTEKSSGAIKAKATVGRKAVAKNEGDKNERILVQGVTQACISSVSLSSLPFASVEELASNVQELADKMIDYVRKKSS